MCTVISFNTGTHKVISLSLSYHYHYHVSKPWWLPHFNWSPPCATNMHGWTGSALVQVMACCLFRTNNNTDLLLTGPKGTNFSEIQIKIQNFSFTKIHLERLSANWQPFCPGGEELSVWHASGFIIMVITHLCPNFNGAIIQVRAWMTNYIPL